MMTRAGRFFFGLVVGLALITWIGSIVVERTTRAWFERDITLRAHLVANGARQALVAQWRAENAGELEILLGDLTRDERIMGAAACTPELVLLASTPRFPTEFSCRAVGSHVRASAEDPAAAWRAWNRISALPRGSVQLDAIPVIAAERPIGVLLLIHDLSFIERRAATTQRFLVGAFGLLAAAAAAVTLTAARLSWRDWSAEIRRFLRVGSDRPEFQPILRDVRELVDRIIEEKQSDQEGGIWTAQRLKQTLGRHLHGEKVIIVANREPYIHHRTPQGRIEVLHPASGLVTEDEQGVLVLSEFTGAARELTEALIVNPHDLDAASSALAHAVGMSAGEQRERMRAMRSFVAEFNVYRWAGRMLVDAARIRRRERLSGRLTDHVSSAIA